MAEAPISLERQLATEIERNVSEVLAEWRSSPDELTFPEPVVYPSGLQMDKIDSTWAANGFSGAYGDGEICLLVSTSNFEDNKLFEISSKRPSTKEEGYITFVIFPSNLKTRCHELGKDPKSVVKNAMIDTVCADAQLRIREEKGEIKLAQSKVKGKVGIFTKRK